MSRKCVCGFCSETIPVIKCFPRTSLRALTCQIRALKSHPLLSKLNVPFDQMALEVERQFTHFDNCDRTNVLIGTLGYVGYLEEGAVEEKFRIIVEISLRDAIDFVLNSYTKTVTKIQAMKCYILLTKSAKDESPRWNTHLQSYRNQYESYGYLTYYKSTGMWSFLVREFDLFTYDGGMQVSRKLSDRSDLIMKFSLECKRAGIDRIVLERRFLRPNEMASIVSNGFTANGLRYECDLQHRSFQSLKRSI